MTRSIGLLATAVLFGAAPVRAEFLVGLTTSDQLVTFDSATPGDATTVGITGATGLIGIDYRPTTRELFGVTPTALYTLDPSTGLATLRAALSTPLAGGVFGVDFNPVPDLAGMPSFRVVSDSGNNYRINANTGAVLTDTPVTGGTITASAYTNNDVNPATGTVLYGLDPVANTLLRSTNANLGTYVTQGPLGITASRLNGFDVSGTGVAFAAVNAGSNGGAGAFLYTVDLATGGTTNLGAIGSGLELTGLAALPAVAVPVPPAVLVLLAGGPLVGLARRRV